MTTSDTNPIDPDIAAAIGLQALAWTLTDEDRAARFLALTGLDAEALRANVGDPTMLAALLKFLEAHEPDLVACAEALQRDPAELVAARRALES